jgi:repressor LexA
MNIEIMLTIKQKQLLNYIGTFQSRNGVTPSYEEMKDALELKSKSGIHRLILALEERGFVKRLAHKARALEIIKDGITNLDVSTHRKNVVIADFKEQSHNLSENKVSTIPMLGKIAAGTPIEAIQHNDDMIDVPRELMSVGESYALKVEGDSMINEGIHEGDTVLIKKTNLAENGDIIVALIDDHEATLKRLRKKGQSIALESANPLYETRILAAHRVKIQGKLTGLLRKY